MKTTEGAWLPFVSIMGGAIGSGIANIGYQLSIRRSWSWSSFGWAVAKGAVMAPIGGYAWKAGVRAYRTFRRLPPAVVKPTPPIRQAVTAGTIQGVTTLVELWGMIGIDTIIDIVDNCVMNKNFFRVYQTSWKLFFKRMLRIKNNEKKRVVLIFLILFALPALCISLQYWVEVGIFIALLIILLPLMGFLYFPIFHKYPITPFLIIAILLLVYLLLDAFLLFAFYTLGDIFTGWFD